MRKFLMLALLAAVGFLSGCSEPAPPAPSSPPVDKSKYMPKADNPNVTEPDHGKASTDTTTPSTGDATEKPTIPDADSKEEKPGDAPAEKKEP